MTFIYNQIVEIVRLEQIKVSYYTLNTCTNYIGISIVIAFIKSADRYLIPQLREVFHSLLNKFLSMSKEQYSFTDLLCIKDTDSRFS